MRMYKQFTAVCCICLGGTSFSQVLNDNSYTLEVELTGLTNPMGVSVDADGFVYVADSANGRILKGKNGSYSEIVTGIQTSEFNGFMIGPLGLLVAPNQTLLMGEGGGATGSETVWHYDLNGNLIKQFNSIFFGGNWNGMDVAGDGRLLAVSSNGDRVFQASPSGNTWGNLSGFIVTITDGLVAPTDCLDVNGTLYVTFHGNFFAESGFIATYNTTTGALLNPSFLNSVLPLNSISPLSNGKMLVAVFGGVSPGSGAVISVDPVTAQIHQFVSQISFCTSAYEAPDGTIYFTDIGTPNTTQGRLLKLVPAPEKVLPTSFNVIRGLHISGNAESLWEQDGNNLVVRRGRAASLSGFEIWYSATGNALTKSNFSDVEVNWRGRSTLANVTYQIRIQRKVGGSAFSTLKAGTVNTSMMSDSAKVSDAGLDPANFVNPTTGEVTPSMYFVRSGFVPAGWQTETDVLTASIHK